MATTIERFKFARKAHPWNRWTNGKAWRAIKGEDFTCSVTGFVSSIYTHARRSKLAVKVARKGDTVEFQFKRNGKKGRSV